MRPGRLWLLGLVVSLALAFPWSSAKAQEPPRVDKETLKSWLAASEVLIFDVRQPEDWQGSDKKIKGAVRQDPKDAKTWVASLPKDKKIVLYCS